MMSLGMADTSASQPPLGLRCFINNVLINLQRNTDQQGRTEVLHRLRMLCAAHCSAAWPGQLLFPYLWLCSAALPLWGHGGAAGKHEWKNKGGFFSFQMVWSCSVIMQAMCGIWASLGVGYKELKGLGQFFFPFQNEFRCR